MKTAIFTLGVLVAIVVGIYAVFPARDHVLITAAIASQRDPAPRWELVAPSPQQLVAYLKVGVPVPTRPDRIAGAREIAILDRPAVIVRFEIAGEPVTFAVQRTRGIAPDAVDRVYGDLRAIGWRVGGFTVAAVGRDATRAIWLPLIR